MKLFDILQKKKKKVEQEEVFSDISENDESAEPVIRKEQSRKTNLTKMLIKKPIHRDLYELITVLDDMPVKQQDNLVEVINLEEPTPRFSYEFEQQLLKVRAINKRIIQKQVCAICLEEPSGATGTLQCSHFFCLQCIMQSTKFSSKCPYCREEFTWISSNGKKIPIQQKQRHEDENYEDQPCYVCGRDDRHHELLVCDICEYACCHIGCDPRLNGRAPSGNWYCNSCTISLRNEQQRQRNSNRLMRNLATIIRHARRNS